MMTRISVALATYNGAEYLEEQLRSLAAQALLPCELVVSDDGSQDATCEIVRAFAGTAPFPVKLFTNECPIGYRLNFRRAAQACTGDLIAFCDQDDVWRPDKLATMAECFDDPEVLLAYHNATVFAGETSRPLLRAREERSALAVQPIPPFKACNGLLQVFRASLREHDALWDLSIDQNEGDVILAHDQWYFFLALLLGKVAFVDKPLASYRQHGGNTLGVRADETAHSRLAKRFVHFGDQDTWGASSAESRAVIADALGKGEIARAYRQLAERWRRRAAAYSRESVLRRCLALTQSIASHDYGASAWHFQRPSLVRDAYSGVLRGRKTDRGRQQKASLP